MWIWIYSFIQKGCWKKNYHSTGWWFLRPPSNLQSSVNPSCMATSLWRWLKEQFHRQAAKMIFIDGVAGLTYETEWESSLIWEALDIKPLLLYNEKEPVKFGQTPGILPLLPPSESIPGGTIRKENWGRMELCGVGVFGDHSAGLGRKTFGLHTTES